MSDLEKIPERVRAGVVSTRWIFSTLVLMTLLPVLTADLIYREHLHYSQCSHPLKVIPKCTCTAVYVVTGFMLLRTL